MEKQDKDLIEAALKTSVNARFKKLYEEHKKLNEEVEKLANNGYLTEGEQVKLKQLKSEKLVKLEELLEIAHTSSQAE